VVSETRCFLLHGSFGSRSSAALGVDVAYLLQLFNASSVAQVQVVCSIPVMLLCGGCCSSAGQVLGSCRATAQKHSPLLHHAIAVCRETGVLPSLTQQLKSAVSLLLQILKSVIFKEPCHAVHAAREYGQHFPSTGDCTAAASHPTAGWPWCMHMLHSQQMSHMLPYHPEDLQVAQHNRQMHNLLKILGHTMTHRRLYTTC
jgi:hypothetical protein